MSVIQSWGLPVDISITLSEILGGRELTQTFREKSVGKPGWVE